MALAEFQRLLLRLYTDKSLQEQFYSGKLKGYEETLSEREKDVLRKLPRPLIENFRNSLVRKRAQMIDRRLITAPYLVISSSFSNHGPVLSFKKGHETLSIPIRKDIATITRRVYEQKRPLSFSSVLRAYSGHANIPLGAAVQLWGIIRRHNLAGRTIICL